MAFQGNLRDFSLTEILQLLGTQKKTGCLMLEWNERRAHFYVMEGRIVSTRQPGMAKDDPLLKFLLKVNRLSNEQYRGLITIQKESNRDLEDLLVNGRYLEGEELSQLVERQILDDMMRVTAWDNGSYRFDPHTRWPYPSLTKLGVEPALIEVARRQDETKRFAPMFEDKHQLLGVRDLPDAEDHLSDEECDLFGIIDGRHTLLEILEAAPLTEYETYEALYRMIDTGWVEINGRRDPAVLPIEAPDVLDLPVTDTTAAAAPSPQVLTRELMLGLATIAVTVALVFAASSLHPRPAKDTGVDVFTAARERDVRYALSLYRREHGGYPARLDELASGGWIASRRLRDVSTELRYSSTSDHQTYALEVGPAR